MLVPFEDARPGDEAHIFICPPNDEFAFVASDDWFDDIDDPTTVKRQVWKLVSEETVVFHHSTELCATCHGDGSFPSPAGVDVDCQTCGGDGGHPLAGQMEVL